MTKTNKNIINDVQIQEQVTLTQPTPCSKDIKESVRSWFHMIHGEKYYLELYHMLRMAVTSDYLNDLDMQNLPKPEVAGAELLQRTADAFKALKEILAEERGITLALDIPDELTPYQVAKLMMALCHIRLVVDKDKYECGESGLWGQDTVMLYVADKSDIYDGESDIGTYTSNFWLLIETISQRPVVVEGSFVAFAGYADEVEFWLRIFAKKVSLSYFQGFMPLENGVLNCRTKELLPFSPEYVFDECTYGGVYAEGEDGPVIRFAGGTERPVDDWIKGAASGADSAELRRVLTECV